MPCTLLPSSEGEALFPPISAKFLQNQNSFLSSFCKVSQLTQAQPCGPRSPIAVNHAFSCPASQLWSIGQTVSVHFFLSFFLHFFLSHFSFFIFHFSFSNLCFLLGVSPRVPKLVTVPSFRPEKSRMPEMPMGQRSLPWLIK